MNNSPSSTTELLNALEGLPHKGWLDAPPAVTQVPGLAEELGLSWLGFKRDDQITSLYGGSKVRKLDYLLAAKPFASARKWLSVGAIGSGHLVTLTAAAQELDREVIAGCFWTHLSPKGLENLAFLTNRAQLRYQHSRPGLVLRHPTLILGTQRTHAAVIAPGASCAIGILGMVRAGLELAAQVEAGALPSPERIYVPFGSGGTVAGLALGLGMAGLRCEVRAVVVVERIFAQRYRLQSLIRATQAHLVAQGLTAAAQTVPVPVHFDRTHLGKGYGHPTDEALGACTRLEGEGIPLEPVYSGKAMAALLADAAAGFRGRALFWVTPRGGTPLQSADDWESRLPRALRLRLGNERRWERRRMLQLTSTGALGLMLMARLNYDDVPDWSGKVFANWEAAVFLAVARALLPPASDQGSYEQIPHNIDRYIRHFAPAVRRDLHLALVSIEHGTSLGFRAWRMSALSPASAAEYLDTLRRRGGLQRQLYRAVRDLCMLGYYQQTSTWSALNYDGPMKRSTTRRAKYASLVAPPGAQPQGWQS